MSLPVAYEENDIAPGVLPPAYGGGWAIPGQLQPAYGNTSSFDFTNPNIAFDSRITFTRSTIANRFNSAGVLTSTAIDVARANALQDYNPSTLAARGFYIETVATNALVNTDTLATQDVAVTAAQRTLSFWGTGTITLSGASTAGPLVGTGANDRVTLTFTPSAGTLTLTVSGTVTRAQLETGAYATSYYPSGATPDSRDSDNASVLSLPSIGFNAAQGSMYCEFMLEGLGGTPSRTLFSLNDGTQNNRILVVVSDGTDDAVRFLVSAGGVSQAAVVGPVVMANALVKVAVSWTTDSFRMAVNGTGYTEDTSGTVPTVTRLDFGKSFNINWLDGWLPEAIYNPQHLTTAQLVAMTA